MKAKIIDIETNKFICLLNELDAKELGIFTLDRAQVTNPKNKSTTNAVVDISDSIIKKGQIGLFNDVAKVLSVKNGDTIEVAANSLPKSVSFVKKKLEGKRLSELEIKEIVRDIRSNRLSDIETAAFVSSVYINGFDLNETVSMTKALIENGKKIDFGATKTIVDKHSIGGTNGRTTMVIVPIIAESGLVIPKTSSRTITSACGTADAMEVLANVHFSIEQIKKIAIEVGGIIAWGGAVDLAPVDDKIIKIEHPLSLDPQGQVIASVMAKKFCAGAKFLVIDIPVGPEGKIKTAKMAHIISNKFQKVGKVLGIKVKVVLTDGKTPSGPAFGPCLEAKHAMEILEGKVFDNCAQKSILLAGALLELSKKQKKGFGQKAAKEILQSGRALKRMREIIRAQGGKVFSSEKIVLAKLKKTFSSQAGGKIKLIHLRRCINIAHNAGAPADKKAGLLLKVKLGQTVAKGDSLFEIFAENKQKLEMAYELAKRENPVEII